LSVGTPPAPDSDLPRWNVLYVTTLGAFMVALDSNIVTLALPYISKALSTGYSTLSWVLAGYLIALAALLLQSGKLGDFYGKKRVYLIGFSIFGVASALCGLSPDAYQLIAYRIIQGAGASIILATGIPLVFASFPPRERGMAIGVQSAAYAAGSVAGPVLGGALTSVDWRLIFFINVPIALAAVLIGRVKIPKWLNARIGREVRLNVLDATLLAASIALVVLWLTFFEDWIAVLGVLGVAAFIVAESRSSDPLINRELLRSRGFVYSTVALGLIFTSFAGIAFVMSFYFQSVAGFSPLVAGLWIAPLPLGLALGNPLAGEVFDRLGRPALASIVAALVASGSLIGLGLAILTYDPGVEVALLLFLAGFAAGFEWTPSISSVLRFARPELRGLASGTAYTVIQIGFATSIAMIVSISTLALPLASADQIRSGSVTGLTLAISTLFDQGLGNALLGLAVVGLAAVPFLFLLAKEQGRIFGKAEDGPAPKGPAA
jgi:EmrB/QacA subfamily drug resistance transporter